VRDVVINDTRKWVERIVVGLNLCPFARRVTEAGLVRYAVTDAEGDLLSALASELTLLAAADRAAVETTILIHPRALTRFLDFLPEADRLIRRLSLRGGVQFAGFHPSYQFRGTEADAAENATNRSPHPMMHLLREASVAEAGPGPPGRPRSAAATSTPCGASAWQRSGRDSTPPGRNPDPPT
jgi:hypothetical protein